MKNFTVKKQITALTLALILALVPAAAFAAIEVSAAADKATVQAGDTVEVTVTVTGKKMSAAQGTFTYDPAVLTYAGSDGGASDGMLSLVSAEKGGASTLSARIQFTAAGAGTAKVDVSLDEVLDYDGESLGTGAASVSVEVTAAPAEPTPAPLNYAVEGVKAENVSGATEELYIWRTLENVTIPSKYAETTLEYHGETVAAATVADSDAPTLLYLSNAAGDVGGYYIYNAAADTLHPYQTVSSVSKSYILLPYDSAVAVPEGFTETTLTIDEKQVSAWSATDAQGAVYLLYARNPSGETGFYAYNTEDESLQRYAVMPARPVQPTLAPTPEPVPEEAEATPEPAKAGDITLSRTVFYIICGAGALLVAVIIIMAVSQANENARRKRRAAQRRAAREKEAAAETEATDETTVES